MKMNNIGLEAYYFKCIKTMYSLEDNPKELLNFQRKLKEENLERYIEILNLKKSLESEIVNIKQAMLYGDDPIINEKLFSNV
ncbi:hypothetical protein [uncultured Methanobrevibacter sp.]|uniref:hypothetical protein n=1 Tax=uncultured Methanobrevibacter sp. TaxID=253161 RepID=UPI0025D95EBD|nr:hypothetical protein [uncultured Methanobrevibacter sp.]